MANPWEDIDNTVQGELEVLIEAFDAFERSLDASVTWLLEDAPYA